MFGKQKAKLKAFFTCQVSFSTTIPLKPQNQTESLKNK